MIIASFCELQGLMENDIIHNTQSCTHKQMKVRRSTYCVFRLLSNVQKRTIFPLVASSWGIEEPALFRLQTMHDRLLLLSSICSSLIQDYEPFLIAVFYFFWLWPLTTCSWTANIMQRVNKSSFVHIQFSGILHQITNIRVQKCIFGGNLCTWKAKSNHFGFDELQR